MMGNIIAARMIFTDNNFRGMEVVLVSYASCSEGVRGMVGVVQDFDVRPGFCSLVCG